MSKRVQGVRYNAGIKVKKKMPAGQIVGLVFLLLFVAILAWVILVGFYYPEYRQDKNVFDIGQTPQTEEITVMSYNIRYFTPLDDLFEKSWFYRAGLVRQVVEKNTPDVIGFQEVGQFHTKYLKEHLAGYDFIVGYRDNSLLKEGVMLAYRTDRFDLIKEGVFWLSDTPEKQSKNDDSQFCRIAGYLVLKEKATGREYTFFDTHLDNKGNNARANQLNVILEQAKTIAQGAVVLFGDMNDFEDSLMYENATNALTDAMLIADKVSVGTGATYQRFGKELEHERIDYFFVSEGTRVTEFTVDTTTFDGVYPSDHFPLIIKIK